MSTIKIPHDTWIFIAIDLIISYNKEFQHDTVYVRTLVGNSTIILDKKFRAHLIPSMDDNYYLIEFDDKKSETLFRLRYSGYLV